MDPRLRVEGCRWRGKGHDAVCSARLVAKYLCRDSAGENRCSATLFAQPYLNANLLVQSFGILGESSRQSYKAAWANVEPVTRSKAYVILAGVKTFLDSIVSAADEDRAKLEVKNEQAREGCWHGGNGRSLMARTFAGRRCTTLLCGDVVSPPPLQWFVGRPQM